MRKRLINGMHGHHLWAYCSRGDTGHASNRQIQQTELRLEERAATPLTACLSSCLSLRPLAS